MHKTLREIQDLDAALKAYNQVFKTNFRLVVSLIDGYYMADFILAHDDGRLFCRPVLEKGILASTKMVSLAYASDDASGFYSAHNDFAKEISQFGTDEYATFKDSPDALLQALMRRCSNETDASRESLKEYPCIYNVAKIDNPSKTMPFMLADDSYDLIAIMPSAALEN